ncbi:hypothetical protein [Butyrivibrio sp. AE2015]|uniref:hypothetical protein n=1 Tax=Butyrivibrio sp. AE2015 TaxID=1280663 RepID=UPI0003B7109F|nr:hypothetical protein [Butyrivibrio sp. AE2015]
MKLIDNGREYVYTMLSGEKRPLEYGSLLIRLGAVLKNIMIEQLYLSVKKGTDYIFDTELSEDFFIKANITGVMDKRFLDIFFEEDASAQREIIIGVIKEEVTRGGYSNGYDVISNIQISDIFEKILLGEKVESQYIFELLGLGKLVYTPILNNKKKIVEEIELTTLGQLITMEVKNVYNKKNPDLIYKRCIICGNLFATYNHRGNQEKLCDYNYSTGLCKKIRQKELDENRDPYIEVDNKIVRRMYKKKDYINADIEEMYMWQEEYLKAMNPEKNNLSLADYEKKADSTWNGIRKKINKENKK